MLTKKQNSALLVALILNVHTGMIMSADPSPNPYSATISDVIMITGIVAGIPVLSEALGSRLVSWWYWEEEKKLRKRLNRSWLQKKFYGGINMNQIDHKCPFIPTLLHRAIICEWDQPARRECLKKANLFMEYGADLHMVRNDQNRTPFEEIMWYATSPLVPEYREFGKQLLFVCQRNGRMTRAMYDRAEAAGIRMTDEAISAHLRTPRSSVARRLANASKTRVNDGHLDLSKLVSTFLTATPIQNRQEFQERETVFPEEEQKQ
jgi:hypothetical protein